MTFDIYKLENFLHIYKMVYNIVNILVIFR